MGWRENAVMSWCLCYILGRRWACESLLVPLSLCLVCRVLFCYGLPEPSPFSSPSLEEFVSAVRAAMSTGRACRHAVAAMGGREGGRESGPCVAPGREQEDRGTVCSILVLGGKAPKRVYSQVVLMSGKTDLYLPSSAPDLVPTELGEA